MNQDLKDFLQQADAIFEHGQISHFGDLHQELYTCKEQGSVVSPLFYFDILSFSGPDALNFLNNQFTNDVTKLRANKSQYSSYCTPQGRVLANFLLWQTDAENYFALIPKELVPSFQQRLSKYILRAKVKIQSQNTHIVCIGLAGSYADQLLTDIFGQAPKLTNEVIHIMEITLIHRANSFLIIAPADKAIKIWQDLNKHSLAIGTKAWQWVEIQSGIPLITSTTQDQFTPQMLNLDQIGAISFDKGCYPGQEIVARTKYLGKLKKQLYMGHLSSTDLPKAGDRLYTDDMQDASGMIVNTATSPQGGFDILAVIQINSTKKMVVRWESSDGPLIQLAPIKYD